MRTIIALLVVITLLAAPAQAAPASHVVHGEDVMYVGGTLASLKPGAIGRLDLTSDTSVVYRTGESQIEIPYAKIHSIRYTRKLARRYGVVATVAVVIVKRRQRRHFFEISYAGADGVAQVALLEVSKDAVMPVTAVLNARSPVSVKQDPR